MRIESMATSFIYVISKSLEMHKIGIGKNPAERLKQLQTGSSDSLHLIHFCKCKPSMVEAIEDLAHQSLAEHCQGGEWFNVTAEVAIGAVDEAVKLTLADANVPGPVNSYIHFSSEDLKAWRLSHELTQDKSAALMGISLKRWRNQETGVVEIQRVTEFACRYIDEHPEIVRAPTVPSNRKNKDATLLGIRPVQRFESGSPSNNAIIISRTLDEPDIEKIVFFSLIRNTKEVGIGHRIGALIVTSRTAHIFDQSECHITTESPHRAAEVQAFIEKAIKLHPDKTFTHPEKLLSFQIPEEKREAIVYLLKAQNERLTSYSQFYEIARSCDPNVF